MAGYIPRGREGSRAVGRGLFSGVSLDCDQKTLWEKGADLQCQQAGTRLPTVRTDFIARRSLLPKCLTVARYTRKYNVIYAHQKTAAFHAPVLTNLPPLNSITFDSYVPNLTHSQTINVKNSDGSLSSPLSPARLSLCVLPARHTHASCCPTRCYEQTTDRRT